MNKLLLILFAAVNLVLTAQGADAPPDAPAVQLVLELSDGSRIIGTTAIDRLKITTQYSDLEIRLPLLSTIEFNGTSHTAQVSLKNGDLLNGKLGVTEIEMKTIVGQVVIPLKQVCKLHVAATGGALPEGLVLHYTFDTNEGDKVTDASDGGNDGKVHGATYASEGKIGGAMSFNGNQQAIVIGNPTSLRLQDFTIMAWIKRGSMTKISNTWPQALIFGYGQAGYNMGIDNNGTFFVGKVGFNAAYSSCRIKDDAFHHLAVTKKGSKIVFYLDGVAYPGPDYDATFEFNTDAGVGARSDTFEASFLGLIDEVAVFNRVLSDDEVKGVYDLQK